MKYFLIAGEASGDLHASRLITALKETDAGAEFSFIGGDLMTAAAGSDPVHHFRNMNYMGFFSVLQHLKSLQTILKNTKESILGFQPDVLILVDYAGFNLRIARFAASMSMKVFYYISPKIWAWRKSRIKYLREYVSKIFVIFPFEVEFYRQNDMEVEYKGNPLMDAIEEHTSEYRGKKEFVSAHSLDNKPIIALLAGSRKQEIMQCLPVMLSAAESYPEYQFVVAGAPSVDASVYEDVMKESKARIVFNKTYQLLSSAEAAIVTSGTATLETALLNVPQMVIYKTGNLTYRIGRLFVNFKFFSLVNLILNRELVKEYLQFGLVEKIKTELNHILNDEDYRSIIQEGYSEIRTLLGEAGVSKRVAETMIKRLT